MIAVALLLFAPAQAHAAATLVVDADGAGTATDCNAPDPAFSTVGAAVAAAADGDTIVVCPGTYTERVTVDRSVVLQGAQAGVDARSRSGPESVMNGPDGSLLVTAPNVFVDGFTFTGQTGGAVQTGAVTTLAGGAHLINDIFSSNIVGVMLGSNLTPSPSQSTVQHDLFTNNTNPGPDSGAAIYSNVGLQHALIRGNQFTGNPRAVLMDGSAGATPYQDITVASNTGDGGFQFVSVSDLSVTGNVVKGARRAALSALGGVDDATVTDNTFLNDGIGIRFDADPGNANGTVALHGNCIAKNQTAGITATAGSLGSVPVDASGNWWGSTDGPAGTAGGHGDAVTDTDVTVTPFSVLPPAEPCPQLPTVTIASPTPVLEGNAGATPVKLTISLSRRYYLDSQVAYATRSDTATSGSDFTSAIGTVTIPAGSRRATITVDVLGDLALEPTEMFTVEISHPLNAVLGPSSSAAVTIDDDDQLPSTGSQFPVGGVQTGGGPAGGGSPGAVWLAALAAPALAGLVLLRRRRRLRVAFVAGLALVAAGAIGIRATGDQAIALGWGGAPPPVHHALPVPVAHHRPAVHGRAGMRVQIPAIGVDARVVSLGLNRDRTLQVPSDGATAGWWRGGTVPGRQGPAVIVGHVDWAGQAAVFARLHDLSPGDRIVVSGFGAPSTYVVTTSQSYPKSAFPTGLVYNPTPDPVLRLITCTGRFDAGTGHYADNLIVFARLDRA